MNLKDISRAKNPDMRGALAAMQRAADVARQVAIQTDTAIVRVKDGKPIRVTADELRRQAGIRP